MYDTLVVQVDETFQDLCNVDPDQRLGELSKLLANVMQGTVLAEPAHMSGYRTNGSEPYAL